MTRLTTSDKIARLKAWAEENYTKGADTFVECYDDSDWTQLLERCNGSLFEALHCVKRCAAVYRERQADAAHYRREGDL
jgi:hypothetical protein